MRIGIDIVSITEFQKRITQSEGKLLSKLFAPEESEGRDTTSLAGLFAAKEAAIKAGLLEVGKWLDIKILREQNQAPQVYSAATGEVIEGVSLSISHAGDTAVAVVVFTR